jgi:hypothetical protein
MSINSLLERLFLGKFIKNDRHRSTGQRQERRNMKNERTKEGCLANNKGAQVFDQVVAAIGIDFQGDGLA